MRDFSWPTFGGNPQHTGLGNFSVKEKPKPSCSITGQSKPGSGAAVDSKGVCYFGTEKSLIAVQNGSIHWNVPLDYPVLGAPTLYEAKNMLYAGTYKVLAFSMGDGMLKWSYKNDSIGIFICVPLVIEKYNLVVMVSQLVTGQNENRLVALDADTGSLKWEIPMTALCSPCASIDEETIYIGEEYSKFYAISASNGTIKWTYPAHGRVRASPCAAADGTVYFVDAPGNPPSAIALVALHPDGREKWRYYPEQYSNNSSPALGPDGTIYVGFYGMYAVNPDGTKKWEKREGDSYYCGSPVVDSIGNVIYADETRILCYSSEGMLLWTLPDAKQYTSICLGPVNSVYYLNNGGVTSFKEEYVPVIRRVEYDGSNLLTEWDPFGYSDFVVTLYDTNGTMKLNVPVTGCSTRIDRILDDAKTYKIVVTAMAGGQAESKSEERTVITASPEITLIGYGMDNTGELQEALDVAWKKVNNAQIYIATLFDQGGTYKENIPTQESQCRFLQTLDEEKDYSVTVVAASSDGVVRGPFSKMLEPIVKAVKDLRLYYAGSSLAADWTTDIQQPDVSFVCEMVKNGVKLPQAKTDENWLVFHEDLETGCIYKVQIRMESGVVLGPWTEFVTGPYRAQIVYDYDKAGRLKKVTWNGKQAVTYDFDHSGNILKVEYSEV